MPLKKILPYFFAVVFICISFSESSCKVRKHRKRIEWCIAGGSSVMMGDGSTKPIENIKVHDTIMGFDRVRNIFVPSVVDAIASTEHEGFVRLDFGTLYRADGKMVSPGAVLTLTQDHPVWMNGKGWCSAAPDMTKRIQGMNAVVKYDKGDFGYAYPVDPAEHYQKIQLSAIEPVKGIIKAYTVVSLQNKLDCFVVNGIVVGVEPRSMEQGGE